MQSLKPRYNIGLWQPWNFCFHEKLNQISYKIPFFFYQKLKQIQHKIH